jgi:hypothetical protein
VGVETVWSRLGMLARPEGLEPPTL